MEEQLGIMDKKVIQEAVVLTGASLLEGIRVLPGIAGKPGAWEAVVLAGQVAYAESYR